MKIVHLISSGGMYGAEAVILDLSRCLERAGHQSLIATFANANQRNTELEIRAEAQGFEVHALPCAGQLDRAFPARLRTLLHETEADVVHAHGYKADVYAFWAARASRTALVSTCHNWLDTTLALRLYGALDRRLLRSFRRVIAVSEDIRERLLASGVPSQQIALIRNGVDLATFAHLERHSSVPESSATPTFGVAARLSPEKGVDVFLEASALVHREVPGARFLVGGDGPERPSLGALIEALHLGDCTTLLGRQENMPAFYAQLDAAVLPSRMEGLPMALLEAMASGLPVVATTVGEVPQVVQDEQTGLLVAPENPNALAEAMLRLALDPRRRAEMGAQGRNRVIAEFSGNRMMAAYLGVYEQALAEARA